MKRSICSVLFLLGFGSICGAQAAVLTVASTHIGNFVQGQNGATYQLIVSNQAAATSTVGTVTASYTVQAGMTFVSMSGPGWSCVGNSCTRGDALAGGASYPAITVTTNVSGAATSPLVNSASVSGGGAVTANSTDSTVVSAPFTDAGGTDYFFDAVNLMKQFSITGGCSVTPLQYCPNSNVTRAQMAIFIIRAAVGNDTFSYSATPHFTDVPSGAFGFAWVQKMFELGITAGCGGGNYCPNDAVTRGQMSVFVVRARLGAAADSTFTFPPNPFFTDVPSNFLYFKWVQRMKKDSLTAGCTATAYCPNDPVTRGQMAIFIMRGAFNLLLPQGSAVVSLVSPSNGVRGASANVAISGVNTNFVNGTTTVNAGAGVTASNVAVSDSGTLTAQLAIDPAAVGGQRSVVVTTGTEEAVLPNGFRVQVVNAVNIQNFAFSPDPENAAVGSLISWKNLDGATHRVVSDTSGVFDTQNLTTNQSATIAAPAAGTYTYHCAIHPSMKGTVVVQ